MRQTARQSEVGGRTESRRRTPQQSRYGRGDGVSAPRHGADAPLRRTILRATRRPTTGRRRSRRGLQPPPEMAVHGRRRQRGAGSGSAERLRWRSTTPSPVREGEPRRRRADKRDEWPGRRGVVRLRLQAAAERHPPGTARGRDDNSAWQLRGRPSTPTPRSSFRSTRRAAGSERRGSAGPDSETFTHLMHAVIEHYRRRPACVNSGNAATPSKSTICTPHRPARSP